jgi:nucleoside-diphosphate-sugar epimerase
MKILVTGASGGLGRLIIPRLLDLGHEVIATSKSLEKAKELDFFDKVTYLPFDISKPTRTNLFYYFQQPDSVIHLAWDKLNDYRSEDHTNIILEHHKAFVYNLISNGLKDFNGVGTCYEYGLIEGELNESMNGAPVLPYPTGKKMLLDFITDLQQEFQFTLKWIRVFMYLEIFMVEKTFIPCLTKLFKTSRNLLTCQEANKYAISSRLNKLHNISLRLRFKNMLSES